MNKSEQLQIRVSKREKAFISKAAKAAGKTVSEWVLSRVISKQQIRIQELVRELAATDDVSYVFAEIGRFLLQLSKAEFSDIWVGLAVKKLEPFKANYLAALVEQAAAQKGAAVPEWTKSIDALQIPYFATELKSLRVHLLTSSPLPFRIRNIFIDTGLGGHL